MAARPQPSVALAAALHVALAKAQAAAAAVVKAQREVEATPEYKLATDVHAAIARFKASTKTGTTKRGRRG